MSIGTTEELLMKLAYEAKQDNPLENNPVKWLNRVLFAKILTDLPSLSWRTESGVRRFNWWGVTFKEQPKSNVK